MCVSFPLASIIIVGGPFLLYPFSQFLDAFSHNVSISMEVCGGSLLKRYFSSRVLCDYVCSILCIRKLVKMDPIVELARFCPAVALSFIAAFY